MTDGQVSNTESVVKLIAEIKNNGIATTHMIGIGSGVSFDMIRRGAKAGCGEHIFINDK